MLPPGLNRAISDSTSPFGVYPPAEVLRTLEVYLADPRSTDAVYQGLINRACTQTISVQLVEKVLGLLKTYLLKYTPSPDVLQLLEDFSFRAREVAGLSDSGHKAIQYVRFCLRKLRSDKSVGGRSFRGSHGSLAGNGSSTGSLRGLVGRSREDLTRLGPDGRLMPVKISVGSGALGRSNDRYATADTLPSPTDPDWAAGGSAAALPAFLRQSEGRGSRGWEDLRLPSASQGGIPTEPSWAVPGRPPQLPPTSAVTAHRATLWMQHLPDLASRVTLAVPPSGLGSSLTGGAVPALTSLSLSGAAPISLATIHRCVLDLEDQDIGRHLAEVLGEARAEAEQLQPTTSQQRQHTSRNAGRGGALGGGGHGARDNPKAANKRGRPARLLFHHPPYNRAEQLPMTESDISVVVEAVCGVRAANALSAVHGPPAAPAEDAAGAGTAGQPEGMWQAAFEEDGEFAQMCGSILMKLIVDLWKRAPVGSYMLALRMLRAALRSDHPSTRARAFDVLYNLSVHGAMLRSEAEEAALAAAATEMSNGVPGARGVQMPWQVCASAPVSPFMSGGGGGGGGGQTPPPAPRPTAAAPSTPVGTTAAPPPPLPAAPPLGGASGAHHVASHSLGLAGSNILDTGGSIPASGSGPAGARGTIKVTEGPGAGTAAAGRKDGSSTPAASPAVKVPALGGAAGVSGAGEGSSPTGYDRWLRALLFQLLCDLTEEREYSEEVWRAAMGCVAQLCSHGGFWVAAWVQHMPPAALTGLLRAACSLCWSQELYARLLQLVPHVLLRPAQPLPGHQSHSAAGVTPTAAAAAAAGKRSESAFAAPAGIGSAAAAAAEDAAASAAAAAASSAAEFSQRLIAFGGLDELLMHFVRAPTPDARAALLTVLAFSCHSGAAGTGGGEGTGSGSVSSSGERLPGVRSPRTSSSPGNRGPDGGPAVMLAALQGLHLDSVCLVLRAALARPWPGMSSRLADVLASASFVQDPTAPGALHGAVASPAASLSGSADYAAAHSLPAGVASPIAVRALLRPLLEALEYSCADSMAAPQAGERCTHMDISVAHVLSGVGGPGASSLTAANVEAAWRSFKETCTEQCPESRQLALNWLHQLLSAACRACQGQLPLLSPLSLRASQEGVKPSPGGHPAGGAGHPAPPLPQWNVCLADALLHVVREAPLGCELLMSAISRVTADQKALLAASDSPLSPLLGAAGLAAPHGGGGGAAAGAAAGAAVPGVTGEEPALAACRRVMWLYYVGLQWMLQCGSVEARMPAVVELADTVLAALLLADPAAVHAASAASGAGAAVGGAASGAAADKTGSGAPGPMSARGSNASLLGGAGGGRSSVLSQHPSHSHSQQQLQLGHGVTAAAAAAAAAASTAAGQVSEPGGGMLISQQLLAGLLAVDPDALSCTPPELLVTLLQQCSQSFKEADGGAERAAGGEGGEGGSGGFRSMNRGFIGRPCAVGGGVAAPAAAMTAGSGGGGGGGGGTRASSASVRISAASAGGSVLGAGGGGGGVVGGEPGLSCAAVGPWQDEWQDRRLALLLLLMARCSLDAEAFAKYSLSHVIKAQLGGEDLRCRYYAGVYLLKHWMLNQHDKYWRTLRHIIGTAQQLNDERLLDNPYLQMRTMLNVDHA